MKGRGRPGLLLGPGSPRWVAFLRAINVGGRTVTMARLAAVFGEAGYEGVETFLASGNVIFDAPAGARATHERRLETALTRALGYRVPVFVRSLDEIAEIATYAPFDAETLSVAGAFNVAFLSRRLDRFAAGRVQSLTTDLDRFHVHGSEVYWLCRARQSQSTFNNVALERALGRFSTLRGINTVRRLAAKYAAKGANDGG